MKAEPNGATWADLMRTEGMANRLVRLAFVRIAFVGIAFVGIGVTSAPPAEANHNLIPRQWVQRWASQGPSPRDMSAMTYDAARKNVVLFGGDGAINIPPLVGFGRAQGDTWIWDGSQWTQRFPGTSPPPRYGHGIVYDAARQQVVMFGGRNEAGTVFNDTWVWNGTTWALKSPTTKPPARWRAGMAYDLFRGQVVLFGGERQDEGLLGDTWVWNGTTWAQRTPATAPTPRRGAAMAFHDDCSGCNDESYTYLFGGQLGDDSLTAEHWRWNGTTWEDITKGFDTSELSEDAPPIVGRGPAPRWHAGLVWDPEYHDLVLFGGIGSLTGTAPWHELPETWSGPSWDLRPPEPLGVGPARFNHAMTYDAEREEVVLFGGGNGVPRNDTWTYAPRL